MNHLNKNEILALFYHEATGRNEKKMMSHLPKCESCQEYLNTLHRTNQLLNCLSEETPLPETFDLILEDISPIVIKPQKARPGLSIKPIMHIAFALILVLMSIYFVQIKITLLPIWQSLKTWWFVEAFGSFGVATVLFFCIGTFITLALTPILLLKTKQLINAISC